MGILIIIIVGILFLLPKKEISEEILPISEKEEDLSLVESSIPIFVDIKGEIKVPGVYQLKENSRVEDAINISGGLTDRADTSVINLSKTLTDEMVIIIYSKQEILEMKKGSTSVKIIEKECICPKLENDACIEDKITNSENSTSNNSNSNIPNGKVSLNKASSKELMSLTGIGESKAKAIISYREKNGGFKSIDEIKKVSGIGEATYEKIKDQLTL